MNAPTLKIGETTPRIPHEVAALVSALHLGAPNLMPLRQLSDEEWTSLLTFCNIAHLTLPLAQLPRDGFPRWVVERLETNLADNALRFESIKAIYSEAAEALDRAGVEHLVIKGFTQAPDYVASPRLRSQSDLDLFCPPEQIEAAQAALQDIGYKSEPALSSLADHAPILVRLGDWQWRGNPFDPDMPLGIELHFCLWNEKTALFSVPVEDFWNRRITRTIDGLAFPSLHPIDHLGHLALHILRNILLRDWIIHHVRELAVFLHTHAHDELFWNAWSETHDLSLQSFEAVAFSYARDWFGCSLHPLVKNAIAGLTPLQHQWLNDFSSSALEVMFRQNKDSIWLHLTFLPSTGKKWTILKRSLIPSKIAPIKSPIVKVRNKRLVQSSGNHPWQGYLAYLISRSASHSYSNLVTLLRGFRWRLSQHRLPRQFWIFLAASFFFDLGLSIFYFLFNLFLIGHGYTEKSLGLITSAMAVGNLVGALPAGRLAQRLGLRPVLLTCFFAAISISSARALLLSFPSQLALAFFAGITLSAWAVCLSPAVAQLTNEKQRPTAFSLLFSLGIGLGAIGGLAGSRLPGWFATHHLLTHSLQPTQFVLLLSCGIVALGIWPVAKLTLTYPPVSRRAHTSLSPFLLRFLPAIAIWSLVTGSFSPLANVYFARHLHMSLPQIGNAFSLSQIAQVAAVLVAPILFRRLDLVAGIVSTQLAAALLLLTLASISNPFAATAAYIGFSAFQWMNEPGLYSLLMNMVPANERGGASASNSVVSSASQIFAAALTGAAFARYGYPFTLRAIALVATLAATLLWTLQDHPQREPATLLDDVPV